MLGDSLTLWLTHTIQHNVDKIRYIDTKTLIYRTCVSQVKNQDIEDIKVICTFKLKIENLVS